MRNVMIKKSTGRDGVSLLEILICIGILSIGLLSVVSLIPAGHFAVVETTKADRSTACARAAKAQVQLRNMLDPSEWRYWWNITAGMFNFDTYGNVRGGNYVTPSIRGATVVIDPLGMASFIENYVNDNSLDETIPQTFPHKDSINTYCPLRRFTTKDVITNASSGFFFMPSDVAMLLNLNDRICRWADDVVIDVDDTDPDLRPRQMFTSDSATDNFGPYPTRTTDDPQLAGIPILRESTGDFSWFLTVTPLNDSTDRVVSEMRDFEVSTVVCYKRDLSFDETALVPKERNADVFGSLFMGISGAGASDIPLMCPGGTTADPLEYLDVKPGQWIMLVGRIRDDALNYIDHTNTFQEGYRRIGKWYRVLSVDDAMTPNNPRPIRWVTVTGPEWRVGPAFGEIQNTQAILVDSVIGVFTETMTLDR